jgi:hypothetical protein
VGPRQPVHPEPPHTGTASSAAVVAGRPPAHLEEAGSTVNMEGEGNVPPLLVLPLPTWDRKEVIEKHTKTSHLTYGWTPPGGHCGPPQGARGLGASNLIFAAAEGSSAFPALFRVLLIFSKAFRRPWACL